MKSLPGTSTLAILIQAPFLGRFAPAKARAPGSLRRRGRLNASGRRLSLGCATVPPPFFIESPGLSEVYMSRA